MASQETTNHSRAGASRKRSTPELRKLKDQVIVITGASSGIGLATARAAAKQGAKVVLAARNEPALRGLAEAMRGQGFQVEHFATDVAKEEDVDNLAKEALRCYGRLDTWINNAGVSIYGRLLDISIEDAKRLFDTNFWGVVYGCRAAVKYLRKEGGALINVGSTVSDRAIPLQGMYSASKHAIKAFTDSLRMELEEENLPISVTLIKPSAIDTPYVQHAKNYLDVEPSFPPPVYDPSVVADAILHAAQYPTRDVFVGRTARAMAIQAWLAPRLTDLRMEKQLFDAQRSNRSRPEDRKDALHDPGQDGRESGVYEGKVLRHSLYTSAALHPIRTSIAAAGALFDALKNKQPLRSLLD